MIYTIEKIASVTGGEWLQRHQDDAIQHLLTDSRKVVTPATSVFFALKGPRKDGHLFIHELYEKGVRNFIVSEKVNVSACAEGNFILVEDTLVALQLLAADHRRHFSFPVIGITGSNGKTIVKEWLYQLLLPDYHIVRSPKSFNSQIGVPLSVWQMNEQHNLALFEAGISQQGEMLRLERIIQPTIGILTNIGEAHSEGFIDADHKFREKISLFKNAKVLIGREADFAGRKAFVEMLNDKLETLTWGMSEKNNFIIRAIERKSEQTTITVSYRSSGIDFTIPFADDASVENAITCCCVLLYLGIAAEKIEERMRKLQPVMMRLEMKKGINHCTIINDSYSADLSSLEIALNFLDQQSGGNLKTVIISDFLQAGQTDEELYGSIAHSLQLHQINRLIGIGEKVSRHLAVLLQDSSIRQEYFLRTDSFLRHFRSSQFKDEILLVKGARVFEFEKIVQLMEQKSHQTILEINLNAIAHNLKEYQKNLQPATKVMAMVKAFAYGSGGAEIAGILQFHKVDYLGVAYADEGVELRKAGIFLPIMVMNPEESSFEAIIENNLEPEIYSFELLMALDRFLQREGYQYYPVHIEMETGMNRLGFAIHEIDLLAKHITSTSSFKVVSLFSHLVASEDPGQDNFTKEQFQKFQQASAEFKNRIGYSFLNHIANSAAAIRFSEMQMDMVRLGIGLYGVENTPAKQLSLQTVATLKSTIAQLKQVKSGESVSYGRNGIVSKDAVIATVRIGYADGYPRRLGNGNGKMLVKGKLAPVIGTICMDMTMIDITGIPGVEEGEEVIVFGNELPVQDVAQWAGTIPYEIMTGISQRVKRIYYEE
jgi:alanine racemase